MLMQWRRPSVASPIWRLLAPVRQQWPRVTVTYVLNNVENMLALALPMSLGMAVSGLMRNSYGGLLAFVVLQLLFLMGGAFRRAYDTRTFTRIHAAMASAIVVQQRQRGEEVSAVCARANLSRELVNFFEADIPFVLHAVYNVVGAFAMLIWLDRGTAVLCLLLLAPVVFLNRRYAQSTRKLTRELHDQMEREVGVVEHAGRNEVRSHYGLLSHWRVKLSDCEAIQFGAMQALAIAFIAVALGNLCRRETADIGGILAAIQYVTMFLIGLQALPNLTLQVSRLRDIARRLQD